MPTMLAGFIGGLLIFGAFFATAQEPASLLSQVSENSQTLLAQSAGIVPCGTQVDSMGRVLNPCQACHLVTLAKNLLNFGVYIAVFIAAVMFALGGFYYFTSAGREDSIKKAHTIFLNVFIGIMAVLLAWVIVDTIMKALFSGSPLGQRYGPWYQIKCAPAPQPKQNAGSNTIIVSPATDRVLRCTSPGADPNNCIQEEKTFFDFNKLQDQIELEELEKQKRAQEERAQAERELSE